MKNINKGIDMEVREIVFSNDEEGKSFCDIFVYEPENIGEQSLGNLYIIGEIVNVSENSSYLVNLLASIIKKEFYSNIKRTTIESLEAGLHKANSTLSDIAEQGNIDWVGNLNMVCAVYSGDELHFSQTGNCKTLLIRNGQITDIGKNITRKEKTHPFRTFTNIASGELEIEDIALFITPGFFNIFSLEKLRKLSSSLELDEFAKKLQNSIEQEKNLDTAGSLIMKIKNSEQKEDSLSHIEIELATEKIYEKETEKDNQKVSLENIIEEYEKEEEKDSKIERKMEIPKETEKEKEEIDIDIINKEQDKREGISLDDLIEKNDYLEKEIEKEKPERNVLAKLLKVLNSIFSFLKIKVVTPIVNYIKEISKLVSLHRSLPAERLQQDGDSDISKEVPTETGMKLSQRAKLIPIKNKHLLIIFVIIITVLVWNVISTNYQKEKSDKFEKYSDILSQAENQIGKVESIVIYGDFETARNLLTDAKNSTLEVKNKYDKLDSKADILLKKIQVQFDRVDLVNRIDNPKIAVDLGQTEELKDSGEIIKIGGEYYISDLSNNSLFQVDFENSKANHIQAKSAMTLESLKSQLL